MEYYTKLRLKPLLFMYSITWRTLKVKKEKKIVILIVCEKLLNLIN